MVAEKVDIRFFWGNYPQNPDTLHFRYQKYYAYEKDFDCEQRIRS